MDFQGRLLSTRVLLAALALVPVAAYASPPAQEVRTGASKDESYLLNLTLNLPTLDFWDTQRKEWSPGTADTTAAGSTRIRIVHLWSTTCKPCEKEFPLLKQMDLQMRSDYHGDVQFVYIADQMSSLTLMREFMERNPAMPVGVLFRDRENRLSAELLRALPGGLVEEYANSVSDRQLSLPITLLLDEDNVVRQVFMGSLLNRRGEFVNSLAQLYESLTHRGASKSQQAAKKSPVSL